MLDRYECNFEIHRRNACYASEIRREIVVLRIVTDQCIKVRGESGVCRRLGSCVAAERARRKRGQLSVDIFTFSLRSLVPASLACSGLEMGCRGSNVFASALHGGRDFVAIRIHCRNRQYMFLLIILT